MKVDVRSREVERQLASIEMDLKHDFDSLNMDIETLRQKLVENNRITRDLERKKQLKS